MLLMVTKIGLMGIRIQSMARAITLVVRNQPYDTLFTFIYEILHY